MNLSKMCRICTSTFEESRNLFEYSDNGQTLADKIFICTQVFIQDQADRPIRICENCCIKLERACEFQNLVRNSEQLFQSILFSISHTKHNTTLDEIEVKLEEEQEADKKLVEEIICNEVSRIGSVIENERPARRFGTHHVTESDKKVKSNERTKRKSAGTKDSTDQVFECYKCRERFTSFWKTSSHLKRHDAEEKYKCIVCGVRFILIDEFGRHLCQGCSIQCAYCSESFLATTSLLDHLEHSHAEKTLFKCEKCGHFFSMLLLKQYHMALQHSNEESDESKLFVCKICKKRFGTKMSLRNHEEIHSDDKRKQF